MKYSQIFLKTFFFSMLISLFFNTATIAESTSTKQANQTNAPKIQKSAQKNKTLLDQTDKINYIIARYNDSSSVIVRSITQNKKCLPMFIDQKEKKLSRVQINPEGSLDFSNLTVCESEFPATTKKIEIDHHTIHIPQGDLKRIAVIGDTGCRIKNLPDGQVAIQNCDDPEAWPFQQVSDSVNADKPELVIHLGDYHYRESCSDEKKCAPFKDAIGYGWKPWEADFFKPTQSLTNNYPWLIVRGNHEDCERAFQGYFLLLSDKSRIPTSCLKEEDTQYIKIGDILFINFDTSHVSDWPLNADDEALSKLTERFKEIKFKAESMTGFKSVWFIMHKPIWGVASRSKIIADFNLNLQRAFEKAGWPAQTQFILAGHIHNQQISTQKGKPVQLVIGESGTKLDPLPDLKDSIYNSITGRKIFVPTKTQNQFGYFLMERKDSESPWKTHIKNAHGKVEYNCDFTNEGDGNCTLDGEKK